MVDEPGAAKDYARQVGTLIRDARKHRGWTQAQLAEPLGTSQSAVNRIERGQPEPQPRDAGPHRRGARQRDRLARRGRADAPAGRRRHGGCPAAIDVKSSKNAGVALLCASLLNGGRTVLRKVARIEEVNRILEVLDSHRRPHPLAQRRQRPRDRRRRPSCDLAAIDADAARRTRSIIMFLGPLLHRRDSFELPYAGGCDLGTRTVEPHMIALRPFGLRGRGDRGRLPRHRRPRRSRRPGRSC